MVADAAMHETAIVPDDGIIDPPFMLVDELGPDLVIDQLAQQVVALALRPPDELIDIGRTEEAALPTRFRMGQHRRPADGRIPPLAARPPPVLHAPPPTSL